MKLNERFRGYLPVVVDLETGGFDASVNPLLELACGFLSWQNDIITLDHVTAWAIDPHPGSVINPASLQVTGINLDDPLRSAQDERTVLEQFFKRVRQAMKEADCHRAIMVAHNASFDLGFLNAACVRTGIKRNPFHPFSSLDTASLAAVAVGHTVLQESCRRAGLNFDPTQAHSAAYDAERTAHLFCYIVNRSNFTSHQTEIIPPEQI